MKTLEVGSFLSDIQLIVKKLEQQKEAVEKVHSDVMGIIGLEDALKGAGGNAIRAFYQDCHIPFLTYYQDVLEEYKGVLNGIKSAMQTVEPSSNGYISESFLNNDLSRSLENVRRMAMELTNETNQVMRSVNDIVYLPQMRDDSFVEQVRVAEKHIDQSLEKLHVFDNEQTRRLDSVSESSSVATGYIEQINSMFTGKQISISSYQSGSLMEKLAEQAIQSGVNSSGNSPGVTLTGNSTSERALGLLISHESKMKLVGASAEEESDGILQAIKQGAFDSFAPLAILVAAHKSKLLRVEYTKKKNHYTFKYNRKVSQFLKGRIGPKWSRLLIQKINRTSKQYRNMQKDLKAQKAMLGKEFKDPRSSMQKLKGGIWNGITENRSLHEVVKDKVVKNSSKNMVIPKEAFKRVAGRASATGAVLVGSVSAINNTIDRWSEGSRLEGKERLNAWGRVLAEEANTLVGSVAGAGAGAYIGAAIGGVLAGPFAPFGAAAGAVIGSAIGATVGEWASKYTKKWVSEAGGFIGEKLYDLNKKAKGALDGAKNALSNAKESLFGWVG